MDEGDYINAQFVFSLAGHILKHPLEKTHICTQRCM